MLFDSLQFLLFYIITTILYWNIANKRRWLLLLLASCYFYMAFVPVYIFILGFTIVIDYIAGICLEKAVNMRVRKGLLVMSLVANIGILAFFKYFNFFNTTLDGLLGHFSHHTPFPFLDLLLPIGLSFHTFQAMSYTIEVYRGNYRAERHFGIYALYVMFYPQLVAGPIERPQNILWQFRRDKKYDFENLKSGLMQMAFGLFKKMVIADRLSGIIDSIYSDPGSQNGKTLLVAVILYSFQIYSDFSGYSDIGIGAARTLGYTLVDNFNMPYLAGSLSGFWRRWHMSLSSWFRDYLYIPLGGSRVRVSRKYLNLLIVFLIAGSWHGARWTFVIWGGLHGLLLILENVPKDLFGKAKATRGSGFPARVLKTIGVFSVVSLAWVFFRAPTVAVAGSVLRGIFSRSIGGEFNYRIANGPLLLFSFLLIVLLMIKEYYCMVIPTKNTTVFYIVFGFILLFCYFFGVFHNAQFIYFQF
jgi:alginate O-acetyltransferase complex protein AlgI